MSQKMLFFDVTSPKNVTSPNYNRTSPELKSNYTELNRIETELYRTKSN